MRLNDLHQINNKVKQRIRRCLTIVLIAFLSLPSLAVNLPRHTIPAAYTLKKDQPSSAQQQQRVTGVVTDQNNKPLAGVSIAVKGKQSAVSDANGQFNLTVPPDATLLFSSIGYERREIRVSGRSTLNVQLQAKSHALEEVVINTGYQTIRKRNFTGSATTLDANAVRRDGVADVSRMLEGQVAGVSVQNVSGTFGAAPKIRIRGATSITGENKPLWVVDGIVLEDVINISNEQLSTGDPSTLLGSAVAGLNPDDIATFEILKDAAATSLYGARAMNGVIVITTKRGKNTGKMSTSYTGNFTVSQKPSYNSYDIVDSYTQMSIFNELYNKGWLNFSDVLLKPQAGVFGKMAEEIQLYNESTGLFGIPNTLEARREFLNYYARLNTNWFGLLFNNSLRHEHSLSMSGGSEKQQTYASASILKDAGWARGNEAQRLTANLRTTFTPNSKLSYGFLATAYIRDQNAPGTLIRKDDPDQGSFNRPFDINPFNYSLYTSRTTPVYGEDGGYAYIRNNLAPFNILEELENNKLKIQSTDFKLQGELRYKFLEGFTYALDAAYRYVKSSQEHLILENSNMPRAYRAGSRYDPQGENSIVADQNPYLYKDPANVESLPVSVLPYGGFRHREALDMDNYTFRNSLNYSRQFADKHRVDLFAFQELRYVERRMSRYDGYGYQYDRGGVPSIDPAIFSYLASSGYQYFEAQPTRDRFLAFAGTGTYSYRDRISIGGTIRYDGSNTMGKSSTGRWLPTWNASAAWNVDGESWFNNQAVFSSLKLRSSYGLVASIGIAKNSGLVLRNGSTARPYFPENEPVMNIERLANSELTWEKLYKLNIGADMAFVNNRYTLTVDWYHHDSFDLIGEIRTSAVGGEEQKIANYANLNAKGLEMTFGATVIKNNNWEYRTSLNWGYNKGKITNLRSLPTFWSLIGPNGGPRQGYPQRGLFSVYYAGLDPTNGAPVFLNEKGEISSNVYLQSNALDRLVYEGPIDPLVTGGFNHTLRYKQLSLNVLLTGSFGNKIRLNPAFADTYSDLRALSKDFVNRWVLTGDNQVPALLGVREQSLLQGNYPNNTYNYSNDRVAKGDFVRMKQIRFTYELAPGLAKRIGATSASISLLGNNLFLLYSDKRLNGQDPEFFSSGGVALPLSKDYTCSLKLTY